MSELTPMVSQYRRIKVEYPDAFLFFRLGDFYEMFFEDAENASRILEITLTSREAGKGRRVPMCGVPCHAASGYIARLVSHGHKVAICEQIGDPRASRGLVRREVVRVITPGTVMEEGLLLEKSNHFIAALAGSPSSIGIAVSDISTGEFSAAELDGEDPPGKLSMELARIDPAEVVVEPALDEGLPIKALLPGTCPVTVYRETAFEDGVAQRAVLRQFGEDGLARATAGGLRQAIRAAGALLSYLEDTQKTQLGHITQFNIYDTAERMSLDAATRRNLELSRRAADGSRRGTLLGVLDFTRTAMGGRLLKDWVERPLLEPGAINERLDAVEELFSTSALRQALCEHLKQVYDLERIVGRSASGTANARDLVALRKSLEALPPLKALLGKARSSLLRRTGTELDPHTELAALLSRALEDEPPNSVTEGGILKSGYSPEVDRLRTAVRDGKDWISSLENSERQKTGIRSLKVGFNKVFGYYIEVTRPNLELVPEHYVRKQTLANAERYVTPELKQMEAEVLGAEERVKEIEYQIFCQLRDRVAAASGSLQAAARAVARADALASLAEAAFRNGYSRPTVDDGHFISIKAGRHPVVEQLMRDEPFVPNDAELNPDTHRLVIITGPNMAGKSTFCRQVALIVLMAQIGSFVPAREARIGVVDRVFTRIGASDDLSRGLSTFMVEMIEVAGILKGATPRSLVILDEVGRGTSTYDGLSIAWAVAEYLLEGPGAGCRTLFATHYNELTQLEGNHKGVANYYTAVTEKGEEVVFLRKVARGSSDRSYGIHVARLAGLPGEVIQRARQLLTSLERESAAAREPAPRRPEYQQLSLLEMPDPVLEELRCIDVTNLTPIEALNVLYELQCKAKGSKGAGTRG